MSHAHADEEINIPDPRTESKSSIDPKVLPPYWSALGVSGLCAGTWASGFVGNHPWRARAGRRTGKLFLFAGMVAGLTDPVAGNLLATGFSVYLMGLGIAAGTVYRKKLATPTWLYCGTMFVGAVSAAYHYGRTRYYHKLSHRYPFFKHDFPRKDYKGIDA